VRTQPSGTPLSSQIQPLFISIDNFDSAVGSGDKHFGQVTLRAERERNPTAIGRLPPTALPAFCSDKTPLNVVGIVSWHVSIVSQTTFFLAGKTWWFGIRFDAAFYGEPGCFSQTRNTAINMPHMTVLVTGGVGFVGSHFVRAATLAGMQVVVLDDLSAMSGEDSPEALFSCARRSLPTDVPLVRGDIGDEELVRKLCKENRVSSLVHFAGKIQVGESVRKPGLYFDVNLVRSLRLLSAAMSEGVRQCVFSSTAAVYGTPLSVPIPETANKAPVNPYGCSKLSFEWALESFAVAHGLRFAALRYFNAAGAHPDGTLCERHEPETHLLPLVIDAAMEKRPALTVFGTDYPTADGTCVRDYIHVCDLADVHLLALSELSRGVSVGSLNLGTGRGYSVREVLAAAEDVLGRKVPHEFGPRRAGDPAELVADPKAAQERLGFSPSRSAIHTLIEDVARSRR